MKKTVALFTLLFLFSSGFALDINDYGGDFSSRSVIMSKMFGTNEVNREITEKLQAKKLTPNAQTLFVLIKKGDYENVKLLLDAKVSPNATYYSEYPIRFASKCNQFEILKLLYERGAKLDRGFFSELYDAVKNKNTQMAQYLLDRGARVNYADSLSNNTTLYLSLKNKMYEISTQMIEKGAKPDVRSVKYMKKHKLGYLIPDNMK